MSAFERFSASPLMLVAGLLTVATEVNAMQPLDPQVAELKQIGDAAIDAGHYDDALDAYSRAIAIQPTPALHYNRGRALQGLGRFVEALADIEEFKRTAPRPLLAAVPRLEEILAALRDKIATVRISVSIPHATITIDGNDVSAQANQNGQNGIAMSIDAGVHELRVEALGHVTHRAQFTVAGGSQQTLWIPMARTPEQQELQPPRTSLYAPVIRNDVHHNDARAMTRHAIHDDSTHDSTHDGARFYQTWWFWTGVGVVTVAAVGTAIALSTEHAPSSGDIAPGHITTSTSGLMSF